MSTAYTSISATNLPQDWPEDYGLSGTLGIFATSNFTSDDGKSWLAGTGESLSGEFVTEAAITVAAGVGTYAAYSLPKTDTCTPNTIRYFAVIFDSRGGARDTLYSNRHLRTSLGDSISELQWANDNAQRPFRPQVDTKPNTDQMNTAIAAALYAPATTTQKGLVKVSSTPTDTANPIAMSLNDTRLALALTGANFVFEGDSITKGNTLSASETWPRAAMSQPWFALAVGTENMKAVNGSTVATMAARYVAQVKPLRPSVTGVSAYLFVMIGINDINGGDSAATIYAGISSYVTTAIADGFEVRVGTVMPNAANAQSLQAVRVQLNNLIRTSGWRIIDFAKLLPNGNDTTFFNVDGLHPNATGTALMGYFAGLEVTRNTTTSGAALELTQQTIVNVGAIGVHTTPDNHVAIDITQLHADVGTPVTQVNAETTGDQIVQQFFNGSGLLILGVENQVPNISYTRSIANAGFFLMGSNTPLQLGTGGAANFTMLADGKCGVGPFSSLVSPTAPLHVLAVSGNLLLLEASTGTNSVFAQAQNGSGLAIFGVESSTPGGNYVNSLAYAAFYISSGSSKSLQFGTSGTAWVTIDPSGNVGYGTTSPAAQIHATGKVRADTLLIQGEGAVLSISSNTIAPTASIHHVGAGLLKTITVPSGFVSGTIYLIPDAAFTYDATGNIVGTGTAVIGRAMTATYSSSTSKWYMSY